MGCGHAFVASVGTFDAVPLENRPATIKMLIKTLRTTLTLKALPMASRCFSSIPC